MLWVSVDFEREDWINASLVDCDGKILDWIEFAAAIYFYWSDTLIF